MPHPETALELCRVGASKALRVPPWRGVAAAGTGGGADASDRSDQISSNGIHCQATIAERCVGFPGIVSDFLNNVSLAAKCVGFADLRAGFPGCVGFTDI
jgi:hypothetical protein